MEILKAVLASGALFSFVQFLIMLGFSRKDKNKELEKKVDAIDAKIDKNAAILARTHILRFADDLRNDIHHSEEYFRQQILDCDTYDTYCRNHPDFSNGLTIVASKYIREEFEKMYMKGENQNDFCK